MTLDKRSCREAVLRLLAYAEDRRGARIGCPCAIGDNLQDAVSHSSNGQHRPQHLDGLRRYRLRRTARNYRPLVIPDAVNSEARLATFTNESRRLERHPGEILKRRYGDRDPEFIRTLPYVGFGRTDLDSSRRRNLRAASRGTFSRPHMSQRSRMSRIVRLLHRKRYDTRGPSSIYVYRGSSR